MAWFTSIKGTVKNFILKLQNTVEFICNLSHYYVFLFNFIQWFSFICQIRTWRGFFSFLFYSVWLYLNRGTAKSFFKNFLGVLDVVHWLGTVCHLISSGIKRCRLFLERIFLYPFSLYQILFNKKKETYGVVNVWLSNPQCGTIVRNLNLKQGKYIKRGRTADSICGDWLANQYRIGRWRRIQEVLWMGRAF